MRISQIASLATVRTGPWSSTTDWIAGTVLNTNKNFQPFEVFHRHISESRLFEIKLKMASLFRRGPVNVVAVISSIFS